MFAKLKKFFCHSEGAVTVDWVVLTAAVMLMAVTVVQTVRQGALDPSTGLGAKLSAQNITTTP